MLQQAWAAPESGSGAVRLAAAACLGDVLRGYTLALRPPEVPDDYRSGRARAARRAPLFDAARFEAHRRSRNPNFELGPMHHAIFESQAWHVFAQRRAVDGKDYVALATFDAVCDRLMKTPLLRDDDDDKEEDRDDRTE